MIILYCVLYYALGNLNGLFISPRLLHNGQSLTSIENLKSSGDVDKFVNSMNLVGGELRTEVCRYSRV